MFSKTGTHWDIDRHRHPELNGHPPRKVKTMMSSLSITHTHMGVYINGGTRKWMVDFMENPSKMDDLGVPLFQETPILFHPPSTICG